MKLGAQLARIGAADSNISNALSFSQTQDGYLQKVSEALTRMSELAMLAMDATKSAEDRLNYEVEYQKLGDRVLVNTGTQTFNGVPLFDGATRQVTTDAEANTFAMQGVSGNAFTLFTATDGVSTIGDAHGALATIKSVLNQVASFRAQVGSNIETLTYHQSELVALKNNLSAANSRITDVDVAQESTNYARQNILVQSGTAMLAQANSQPQAVLKLLGG